MSNYKSKITDEIRASATEFYRGDAICQEKSKFLLTEIGLPNGLLPLKNIEETGYIKETGFVWLIQKEKSQHRFDKVNRVAQYDREVTAYVSPGKIKKLTGVKTKELLIWISLSEICIDDPPTGKINFRAVGFSRSFPVEAFQLEEKAKNAALPVDGEEAENVEVPAGISPENLKTGAAVEVKEAQGFGMN